MVVPYFYNPYHFHPELELTYVSSGTGTRYIGDHIESFSEGDLVLVGSNLPHLWKNDKIYYQGDPYLKTHAIVIQFKEDFLGEQALELPEMKNIKKVIVQSRMGLKILNRNRDKIAALMQAMVDQSGAERIINLLFVLNIIAESKDLKTLSSRAFSMDATQLGLERINKVFAYIFENFSEEISLKKISDIANMSPTAFCRYFKTHTNKTFSAFIIETRIHHSCKLIMNENKSLSDIAFESGFSNLSYFTKQFKKTIGMAPREYRKKIGSR
ncbi:MAG TPA: AraC family transcriptional regulator [Puia sp.]